MKAIAISLFVAAVWAQSASALSLIWDPGAPSAHIIQYKIYERLPTGYVLLGGVPPSKTRFDLPALSAGAHTFAVTALALFQESPPSNEVTVYSTFRDFTNTAAIPAMSSKSYGGGRYPSEISISGLAGVISGVEVVLSGVNDRVASRLDVLLVGPQGQKVLLMSDVGGNHPANGVVLTFSSQASQLLGTSALISGAYLPSNRDVGKDRDAFPEPAPAKPYGSSLSVFNGTDPNGVWKLFVMEEGKPKGGSITGGWAVRIDTKAAPMVTATMPNDVTSTTATLTGMVNPMGQPSLFEFNYGLTGDYDNWQSPQNGGFGLTAIPAALTLTGLTPDTTYHYRLVAQNKFGVSSSNEIVFRTLPIVDSDRDGMPDEFELLNHLNPNSDADAALDSDGDGVSNLAEFLAGTDLNDRNSSLRVTDVQMLEHSSVTFTTVIGKRYQLERTDDLAQPNWVIIQPGIDGTGGPVTVEDLSATGLTKAFYRAVVIP